jgi:hypothetical protein
MRNTQVFIAHILWDDEEPGILRGSLRNVASDQVRTFDSQEALVALLQAMMRAGPLPSLPPDPVSLYE